MMTKALYALTDLDHCDPRAEELRREEGMPGLPAQQVTPDQFRQWKLQKDQEREQASDRLQRSRLV